MNRPTTLIGWALAVAALVGILLLASFVAGQIRGCWGPPDPPPVVPGHVDAGTPIAGPVAEAPTAPTPIVIAAPVLTRAQIIERAKKYGMTFPAIAETDTSPEPPAGNGPGTPAETWPRLFAEEHFDFAGVPGIGVDISAWQLEKGGRIDLRGVWKPYQPPTPEIVVRESYFGNTAKFDGFVGLGYAGQVVRHDDGSTQTFADPGLALSLGYKGWRINKITLEARAMAIATKHGGAAFGGLGLGF